MRKTLHPCIGIRSASLQDPAPILSRFCLSASIPCQNTWRIFVDALLIDQGITVSALLKVNVGTCQQDHSLRASIAISAEDVQFDIAAKDLLAQVLFSCLPESLADKAFRYSWN
jgi:hypothetical protein